VLGWLKREKRTPGWFAFSINASDLDFAHGRWMPSGRSVITAYGTEKLEGEKPDLGKLAHALRLRRFECAALLNPSEYQLVLVDAPNVPKVELKSAIRWRIKDMIDCHVDDVTIDVLDIPVEGETAARNHPMYAVAARNELIEAKIRGCEEAKIPLSVIDIQETAQRNIAALYEAEERAVALAYFGGESGLLTINFRSELYLARRFEVGLRDIESATASGGAALERLAVEIQRTLDHFDRSFRSIPVAKLLIAPTPTDTELASFVTSRLGIEAEAIDLRDVLDFGDAPPERETQWRLFHHYGAALRHESKVL